MTELHRNVVKVITAGERLGVTVEPRSYPQGAKTAQDAADAVGVEVGQIVKSLIFGVATGAAGADFELVLAYVSGSNLLDEKKLAAAAGAAKCVRVDADAVRSATGFPIGGVPPFGHDTPLRIFIDPDLLQYDEVWAAAGTWNDVFPIGPRQLAEASGGVVTELRRD
ncbi:MAG: YbaK/EbsC family protein [Ilumatobacter sp.]|uniref:YbaK/EbsC family protein n=1 Tax=Ilumatobacter sp. TaxID=1967498 RepID=UPI0032997663